MFKMLVVVFVLFPMALLGTVDAFQTNSARHQFSAVTMGLSNPFKGLKRLIKRGGEAEVDHVEFDEERFLFTKRNLNPMVEGVSEVDDSVFPAADCDDDDDRKVGKSLGLADLQENEVANLRLEKQQLESELQLIWAIEQRNEAQIGSFVDEEAQWDSMSDEERSLLSRKPLVLECISALSDALEVISKAAAP